MAKESNIGSVLEAALEKLKEISASDTIIGAAIELGGGAKAIPVSKISFGFAGGGSDFGKPESDKFGVGTGGAVTVTPIAFLLDEPGGVRLLQLVDSKGSAVDNIIRTAPEIVNKITSLLKKDDKAAE